MNWALVTIFMALANYTDKLKFFVSNDCGLNLLFCLKNYYWNSFSGMADVLDTFDRIAYL